MLGVDELKKTYNLESFISKRRNELISNVFVLCRVMESKGTGFKKIMDDYKNLSDKYRPFIFAKNNQFSIVLPDLTSELGVEPDNESISILKDYQEVSKYDISILSFLSKKYVHIKNIEFYILSKACLS